MILMFFMFFGIFKNIGCKNKFITREGATIPFRCFLTRFSYNHVHNY